MTKTRGMVGFKLGKKCGHFILILEEVAEYFLVMYFQFFNVLSIQFMSGIIQNF